MKFIDSKDIDLQKFNKLIEKSKTFNIFCYSWYLAATSKKWGAIINDDYTFAIPFAYKSFLGIRKTFQHPYSRHIDFFGDENCVIEASEIIKKFNFYSFNLVNVIFENIKYVSKKYQQIKLQNEVLYS